MAPLLGQYVAVAPCGPPLLPLSSTSLCLGRVIVIVIIVIQHNHLVWPR